MVLHVHVAAWYPRYDILLRVSIMLQPLLDLYVSDLTQLGLGAVACLGVARLFIHPRK